jgi:hypothetical protein
VRWSIEANLRKNAVLKPAPPCAPNSERSIAARRTSGILARLAPPMSNSFNKSGLPSVNARSYRRHFGSVGLRINEHGDIDTAGAGLACGQTVDHCYAKIGVRKEVG